MTKSFSTHFFWPWRIAPKNTFFSIFYYMYSSNQFRDGGDTFFVVEKNTFLCFYMIHTSGIPLLTRTVYIFNI